MPVQPTGPAKTGREKGVNKKSSQQRAFSIFNMGGIFQNSGTRNSELYLQNNLKNRDGKITDRDGKITQKAKKFILKLTKDNFTGDRQEINDILENSGLISELVKQSIPTDLSYMKDTLSFFKHMLKYPTGTMELINRIGDEEPEILQRFFKKIKDQLGEIHGHMVLDMMVEYEENNPKTDTTDVTELAVDAVVPKLAEAEKPNEDVQELEVNAVVTELTVDAGIDVKDVKKVKDKIFEKMKSADKIAYVAEESTFKLYKKDEDQIEHFFSKLEREEKSLVNEIRNPENKIFARNLAASNQRINEALGIAQNK